MKLESYYTLFNEVCSLINLFPPAVKTDIYL